MATWTRIAWKEFWLPFHYWRRNTTPGGKDFLWLTMFLLLLVTFSLVLHASTQGILNRFVDVLIGKEPGVGVPVWVTPNMLTESGINLIRSDVLSDVEKLGYQVYPYREIDQGDLYVSLLNNEIWTGTSKDGPRFSGWAVYQSDPIWPREHRVDSGLTIVLNKSLFAKYFNYARYYRELVSSLPQNLISDLPVSLTAENIGNMKKLWLKLSGDYHEFTVMWVDNIYAIEKVAYLFPISTYHSLQLAYRFPKIKYFPEAAGREMARIEAIDFELQQSEDKAKNFVEAICEEKLFSGDIFSSLPLVGHNACLRIYSARGAIAIEFKRATQEKYLASIAQGFQINYDVIEYASGDSIKYDKYSVQLSCSTIPEDLLSDAQISICNKNRESVVSLDITNEGNGFTRAMVYVPGRLELFSAISKLTDVKENALTIHSVYRRALDKFGFLTRMIEAMRSPIAILLIVALVILIGVQLFTIVHHRRHRYGMFLSKGFVWWQIYFMLYFQLAIALAISLFCSFFVISLISFFLTGSISKVAKDYIDTIRFDDLNLLPLVWSDYIFVSLTVLLFSLVLVTIALYFMPLKPRTNPALLFMN